MTPERLFASIFIVATVTAAIRFAPFIVMSGKKTPPILEYLGKVLPMAVMGMLVVYCLKDVSFITFSGFVPHIIAGFVVVISYVWKKNSLLSIVLGTVCYMLLVQFVFI